MHKSLANIFLRESVEQSLHYARLSTPSCARRCGRTFRVFSSLGHNSTTVNLSSRLGGKVRLICLLGARKAVPCNTALVCLNPTAFAFVDVRGCAQPKRYFGKDTYSLQGERLWSEKRSVAPPQQEKQSNNEHAPSFSQSGKGRAAGETISLFSVDQIREQESPWKALTGISNADRLTRRGSPFKRRLQERKKICMLYGNLQKRALNRYLKEIHRPEELLLLLESRLDVVLKRSALFPSIHSARQSILQGGISVNRAKVRSPRYHCTPGDLIEIIQKTKHISKTSLREQDQTKQGRQSKDYLTRFDKWLDLFAFSELLQLGGRKTGRLYTSVLSYVKESVKTDSPLFRDQGKTGRANNHFKVGSLQDVPSRQPSFAKENLFENQRFQVETPFTFFKNRAITPISQEKETLDQGVYPGTTLGSSNFQKDLITKHVSSVSQVLARENVELERSRAIASRPLHLEVSYRNLCVVFLFPPQRICVDISIDLSLLV